MNKIKLIGCLISFLFSLNANSQTVSWNFDENTWAATNCLKTVSSGIMQITLNSDTKNAYVAYTYPAGESINTNVYKYISIKLKNETGGTTAKFYFRNGPAVGGIYKSVNFTITANDTDFKTYVIDLSANADWLAATDAQQVRFDIPSPSISYLNQTYSIDEVTLLTTLPVSLKSFSGRNTEGAVKLSWSTASEKNNSHFEVLRSSDGIIFNSIGRVEGSNNSDEEKLYSFADINPLKTIAYYQLKQIDLNGSVWYSEIIPVANNLDNSVVKIYRKQPLGPLSVSWFSNKDENVKLIMADVSGRKVFEKSYPIASGQSEFDVDLNSSKQGIYIIDLISDSKVVKKKIFIN